MALSHTVNTAVTYLDQSTSADTFIPIIGLLVDLRDWGLIMKTIKNVLKKRTATISRAGTEFDGQRNLLAEVWLCVVSEDYQHLILSLSHDRGVFQ